jgi:hypothetical protein
MKSLNPNENINYSEQASSIISQCVQDVEPLYKDYCQTFFQTYQAFCSIRPLVKATTNINIGDRSLNGPQLFLYRPLDRLLSYKKQVVKIEKNLQDPSESEESSSANSTIYQENVAAPSSQDLEQLLESSYAEHSELEKLKRLEKMLQVADKSIILSDQHRKILLETKFSVVSCKIATSHNTSTLISPKKVLGFLLTDRLILVTNDSRGVTKRDKILINLERVDLLEIQSQSQCIALSLPGTIEITLLSPSQDLRNQWLENITLVQQNQKMFYTKVTSLSTLKFSHIYSPKTAPPGEYEAEQVESPRMSADFPISSTMCPPLSNNPDSLSTTSDDQTEISEPTTPKLSRAYHQKHHPKQYEKQYEKPHEKPREKHTKRTSSAIVPEAEKIDIEISGIPCYLSRPCLLFTQHGGNGAWTSMGSCIAEIRRQANSDTSYLCIRSHPSKHVIARLPILGKPQFIAQITDDDMVEIQVKGSNFYRFSEEDIMEAKQMINMIHMEQGKNRESKYGYGDNDHMHNKRYSINSVGTDSSSGNGYSRGNSIDQTFRYIESPKPSSIISNDSVESAGTDLRISLTRSSSRAVPSTPRSASLMPRELSQKTSMTSVVSHPNLHSSNLPKASVTSSCLISIPCKFFAQDTTNGAGGKWIRIGHTQLKLYKETKTYELNAPMASTRPAPSNSRNVKNSIKLVVETIENPSKNKPSVKMISCTHHSLRAELSGKRGINRKIALLVEDKNHRIRTYMVQVKDKGIADEIMYWIVRVPQQDASYS